MPDSIHDLIKARFGFADDGTPSLAQNDGLALLLRHRTVRRLTDAPVDPATMTAVLAAGLSAPSKSDLQQATVIRVIDPVRRQRIGDLIPDMPWVASAPEFMVVCGDSRRIRRICELRGRPFANDHLDAFLNAASDAAMVLQNLVTAAEAAGLGTCPISAVRLHLREMIEILGLPKLVFPLAGLCIGHPAHPGYVSLRLGPEITVHTDRYDDSALADDVDAYDRRRDAAFSIPEEKQRDNVTFGHVPFYGWSEDKARQVAKRERDDLASILRDQGFNLG